MPDGCGTSNARARSGGMSGPARRLSFGRLLQAWLLAMLLGWSSSAKADAPDGYVYTASQTLASFENSHPDEPWIWLSKVTYDMEKDLNVYEFKLKIQASNVNMSAMEAFGAGCFFFGWSGDVWLTIDGENRFNLKNISPSITGSWEPLGKLKIGSDEMLMSSSYFSWPMLSNLSGISQPIEINAAGGDGLSGYSSLYVSVSDPQAEQITDWAGIYQWYPNLIYPDYRSSEYRNNFILRYISYVTIRVGIERTWSHKDYAVGVKGTWKGKSQWGDVYSAEYTRDYHIKSDNFKFTHPTVPWPSSSGTLTRSGNGRVTYKTPSASSKTGKQFTMNPYTEQEGFNIYQLNQTESCNFLNNVYLMKSQGNTSNPWSSIDRASDYYAKLENVTSPQTQEITGVDNYQPFYVYPCWELQSQNEYVSMPSLTSKVRQNHDKFMDALVAPGYPCATDVDVKTADAFSRKVQVTWKWKVSDANHCDTNGKWYVFRRLGTNGQTLKIGEVSHGTASEYSINYTPTSDNLPDYGEEYNYIVCFVPNGWTVNSESDATGLWASKSAAITRSFKKVSSITATASDNKVTVSWEHLSLTDASPSNKYVMYVERSEDNGENKTWVTKETIEISDKTTTTGTWEDTNITAKKTYYYRVRFPNVQGGPAESDVVSVTSGGSTFVKGSFMASRGNYSNTVKLSWQVNQVGTGECYFTVQRRPLGSSGSDGWADIYTTHGTAASYSYDDLTAQPGSFNEYKITLSEKVDGKMLVGNSETCDGFCMATGTMSGRVSFGSGTAVEGVKVTMRPSTSDGSPVNRFRSLYFDGTANTTSGGSGMTCTSDTTELKKIFGNDFTIQMWINPSSDLYSYSGGNPYLFDVPNTINIVLEKSKADTCQVKVSLNNNDKTLSTPIYVPYDKWTHLVMTHNRADSQITVYTLNGDTICKATATGKINDGQIGAKSRGLMGIGNYGARTSPYPYKGYMDEVRVFNRCLTQAEIERNYNHPLVGTEQGLQVYYSFDEGIPGQKLAYDFSKQNGVSNGHHGITNIPATSSTVIPSDDQFSLMGYTDAEGNYMVGGISISGDGTNYVATPTLGIHQFSPANQSRYFSMNSLVQTGVDYEDVSSFPVSGVVYYSNTSVPVKDVYIKVDGITASKDGQPVMTNAKGEFKVDVPIGKHFVSVSLNGHTFEKEGRYPEDANGTGEREDFNGEVTGLTFYDNTLVTVAGRVSGGDIEYEKPLGLKQGKANIGQATLTLELENDNAGYLNAKEVKTTTVSYGKNNVDRTFEAASGSARVPANENYIEVVTDAETGEFVAQLPPLRYKVSSVSLPKNTGIHFNNLPVVDATNPNLIYTDSIKINDEVKKFEYVGSAKIKHKEPATFIVKENEDGSFGIKTYTVKDVNGTEHKVPVYAVNTDGTIDYKFGHPVYEEMSTHTFHISASERYINKDSGEDVVDEVPLAGKKVTVKNPFATTAKIVCTNGNSQYPRGSVYEMEDNTFELDSLGLGEYEFTVGYPNIQEPYTRGLTITYNNNGAEQDWEGNAYEGNPNPFAAYILGALPTGNNFVTQGPDEIAMVLRDPPGTGSSATWSKGSTKSVTKGRTVDVHSETSVSGKIYAGVETETGEGIGFMVIQDLESTATITAGAELNLSFSNMKNHTTTITATRDISTSDGFDFNGADGDLFIGSAKNIIFGACHYVDIMWDNDENKPVLTMEDGIATGEEFTTGFAYTQNYVKNILIPNFITLRNSLLTPVSSVDAIGRPGANVKDPIYVTELDKDNPKFGSSNNDKSVWGSSAVSFNTLDKNTGRYKGPSYTMILPESWDKDTTGVQDMVNFYNLQIAKWENELRKNEEAKVTAIQNSKDWLIENHSFDAGAAITVEKTIENATSRVNTEVQEINAIIGLETGYRFAGLGLGIELEEKLGITVTEEQQLDESNSTTIAYNLVEDGDDDYLTVDVFKAPDGFGPIFYTRGGATSCPYQDEVVTEYFEPGTIIMQKTVQIEKPEIEAQVQSITGIPAGGKGTFKVNIRNNSDTGEDGWFDISVVSTSNPDGLKVSMDGSNITTGRSILVPAGETMVKTFTVEQSNESVMEYKDVKIRIASQCQKDNTGVYPEIADTTSFSAYFQPSCSDVHLAANHTLVNTDSKDQLVLSISGYNYSMETLEGIRLQYKGENDADFTTLHEYIKGYEGNDPNKSALIALTGNNKLDYALDLRKDDFSDKTYVFRAVTVCQIGGEVNNESEWVEVVRNMSRPQLIATPTPASGILGIGDDLTITFNEDIQGSALTKPNNFDVVGVLNETEVTHEVALSLTGNNAAKTDATMDLSDKSFAVSMWVNYTSDGRLLMHGMNDNNFTVAIENGKLAVSVNDSKATSVNALPQGEWIYLNVSYDAHNHSVSAGYASDASTVTLLTEAIIDAYNGNGPVSVGGNDLTAKVQELAIWDDSRSMAEAQASMYTSKSQFTNGLMGYWQLNEGHGNVATDKARSRNMTLPSQNAWWTAGDNYALVLDGTKAAAVNIGSLNTTVADDYLVEAWFKADETQADVASVLSTEAMDLRLNAEGKMELVINNETNNVTTESLRDGQWHHVAVNVLKSTNGSGIIYIDGQQRKLLSTSVMPALYGAKLVLGGHYGYDAQAGYGYNQLLKGAVDEVRIWKARRTADVIKNNMYNRVKGDEAGLVAYYPMETLGLDAYNQLVTSATFSDKTAESTEEVSFYSTNCSPLTANLSSLNSNNTAALKTAPTLTNVEFDFVASERQIKVNLNEQPYKMEGCNIYITAKNVKDVYGNAALPITWSVYVQQNTLRWQENTLAVTKTGTEDNTFTATIENRGAQSESWSLSGMPTWLTANIDGGILTPLATQNLTFTVAGSLPIGTYETTLYLTGSQNINAPLNITVSSEGEAPAWAATPGESTMTVVGQLKIDGVLSSDSKDMVAAFRGQECVGVATPKYFSRYDGYFVMLNIYGKDPAELVYKAYDASTGTIYPSVSISDESANTFIADKAIGSFTQPVTFTPNNEIEQDLSLPRDGWKWFSLYATPKDASASVVFKDALSAISTVTDGDNTVIGWAGNLPLDNPATMYKLNAKEPYTESIIGTPTDPTAIDITLQTGWTWIGYPAQASNSLGAAFSSAEPAEGDMVKNQNSFSIYTEGEWVGTLTAMTPGDGYLYNSVASSNKTFRFPKPAVSGKKYAPAHIANSLFENQSEDNMTMIALVMNGDEVVSDAHVSVFAGSELRGYSHEAVRDNRHFITIGGEDGDALSFVISLGDDENYALSYSEIFVPNAQRGSMANPVVLQISEATGINMALNDSDIKCIRLYDSSGRMIRSDEAPTRLFNKKDLSNQPAGIFYQHVIYNNGQTRVQKLMK